MTNKSSAFRLEGIKDATMTNCTAYGGDIGFNIKNIETLKMDNATYWSADAMRIIVDIQNKIQTSNADPEVKKELTEKFITAVNSSDKKSAIAIYDNLIASAANHIAVLGAAWELILSFKQHLS